MDKNVAIIFHRVGPYHFARIRAAGELLSISAIEMSGEDGVYQWDKVIGTENFKRVTIFSQDSRTLPASMVIGGLHRTLDECKPAVVVINGWSDVEALGAFLWCMARGVPAVTMSESTEWDARRVAWKEWIKRRVVRLASSALAGGEPHAAYLKKLGMPGERISLGYDAIDNNYFSKQADVVRKNAPEIRAKLGLPDRYFLASARFVEKKNLPRLLDAYATYRQRILARPSCSQPWSLVLLGDGPLRESIKQKTSALNLQDHVLMPGFVQYPDLPAYYSLAGAFVHPSTTEQWGLVVNEAMASGIPVLVSNRCGCAQDLVEDGVNGFAFDPFDSNRLAGLMATLSNLHPPALSSLGEGSWRIISNWGPDRFATGLKQAVDTALCAPRPKASILDRVLIRALANRRYHAET